jgi:hypothetical protein
MKWTILVCGAIVAGLVSVGPQRSQAQDLRGEIEAIVKDYLAAHPDEIGQIARDYFVRHPEAVGQILAELLKHRSAATAGVSGAAAPAVNHATDHSAATAAVARTQRSCSPLRARSPSATLTATSRSLSSSITIAASANGRCPTC